MDGFNEYGINVETGTKYDKDGYDRMGYDRKGFNREGIHVKTGTIYDSKGYDRNGYDKDGYDRKGLNRDGLNKEGHDIKKFDVNGYDKNGYDRNGYDKNGHDINGYDQMGYNSSGFNKNGIHKKTRTIYDENGYDKNRYDRYGYDTIGYDRYGYNKDGYDIIGYNRKGFNREGIHKKTGTIYDENGYDKDGYDKDGYDKSGYNREGIHKKTGTIYDENGYDRKDYDRNGININRKLDKNAVERGFVSPEKNQITKTRYDIKGFDIDGYDKDGYDINGFNRKGISREGVFASTGTIYDENGYNIYGIDAQGIDRATGKRSILIIAVEQYIDSNQSIGLFCKKNNINKQQFMQLLKDIPNIYPSITREQLQEVSARSSSVYLQKREDILQKLVSGEKTFEEYLEQDAGSVNYDQLIAVAQKHGKEDFINSLLISFMVSGKMKYKTYINLFTSKDEGEAFHKSISSHVQELLKLARYNPQFRQYVSNLHKEKTRLEKFKTPVVESELIGSKRSYDSGKTFIEVTEEHLQQAKQYVRASGEFVCLATVNEAITKILKGEIDPSTINIKQENGEEPKTELRTLIEQKQLLISEKAKLPTELSEKYSSIYSQIRADQEINQEDDIII